MIQTWNYCWSCEIFHEECKQVTGLEAAQVHEEEAVKRHATSDASCVAQSLLQRVAGAGRKFERFSFADGAQTLG